jgi:hypothetical protein
MAIYAAMLPYFYGISFRCLGSFLILTPKKALIAKMRTLWSPVAQSPIKGKGLTLA